MQQYARARHIFCRSWSSKQVFIIKLYDLYDYATFVIFRESQYQAPTDQSTGAINRQIRVTVRTIGEHHVDFNGVGGSGSKTYQDAISIINLNRWCRQHGLTVPKTYWTRLWCVRDCAGGAGAGLTWFLMIAGEVLVFLTLASRHFSFFTLLHAIFSFGCASLGAISHLRAMFTDPVWIIQMLF